MALSEEGITYYVLNENTLGLVRDARPGWFEVLHGSVLRGSTRDWKNGPFALGESDVLRPATKADFDAYRVSWKGHLPE